MKKFVSLLLCCLLLLSVLPTVSLAQTGADAVVDVSFREMEKSNDLNSSNLTRSVSTTKFTQGTASLGCTVQEGGSTGNAILYLYRLGQKSNPANIAGATHLTMDLWVPTDGYFDNIKGDAGIKIDDADNMNKWGGSGGSAVASRVRNGLRNLKAGWNFVVIALDKETTCTNAVDLRFHVSNSGIAVGSTFYIDDVRLVNQAALNTLAADRNAAKRVVGLLTDGEIETAQTAYEALLHRERVYVPADILAKHNIPVIAPTVQYTATFALDGGTPEFSAQTTYVGDTLRGVTRPQKEGFAFGGWYVNNKKVDLATYQMPANDITLTAKWVTPVTLTFDVNGGKTPIEPQVLAQGDVPDPIETPKRGGHRFDGWYYGDIKVDLTTFTMGQTNVTLTAKWLPYRYFLKFNANSGWEVNPYQVVECASTVTVPVTPLREGYVFDGWYNGNTKVDFATFTMPDTDVTLNAKWKRGEETLIGFGKVTADSTVDAKDALELLKYSVKKCDFTTDQAFYGDVNQDGVINAKDALLVLQYSVKKITVFPAQTHYATYLQPLPPAQGPIYPGDPVPEVSAPQA